MNIEGEEKKSISAEMEFLRNENRLLREHLKRLAEKAHLNFERSLDTSLTLPELLEHYKELLTANIRLESRARSYAELLKGLFNSSEKSRRDKNSLRQIVKSLKPLNLSPIGGKACTKAMEAHAKGGEDEVERLLDLTNGDTKVRADVYTTIARQYQKGDPDVSARLAARALECDPRLYRLKWYAFRMHGAGKALEAEALLELLDENMSYNEQEELRIEKIHDECANIIQTMLNNNFTGNKDTNESENSGPTTAMEVFYGKNNEIASESFRGQDFILTHIDKQSELGQICGSEFWGKWLETIREEMSTARSKELAFLLDCLDDQKDVIRKSSEDAWLQVMEKIREEIDKVAKPAALAKNAADDANIIKKQLVLLRLDAFARYGVQTSRLELESAETLEYVLLLLNLVNSRKYDLIIELGEGANTTPILEMVTRINKKQDDTPLGYIFCAEKNKKVNTLKNRFGEEKNIEFCVLPAKKENETMNEQNFKCLADLLKGLPLNDKSRIFIILNDAQKLDFPASEAFSAIFTPTMDSWHDFILPPYEEAASGKGLLRDWKTVATTLGQSGIIDKYACGAELLSLSPHK